MDGTVEDFNRAAPDEAAATLRPCNASSRWAVDLVAARPYRDIAALVAASDAAVARLDWADVEEALAGHPRIGERAEGASREATWSRGEQSKVGVAPDAVRAALAEGNAAYEQRFGHIYLVNAAGRPADELLAVLRERLDHDAATERDAVRRELAAISRNRLARLFGARLSVSTHVLDAVLGAPAAGVRVSLERQDGAGWAELGTADTDADGRIRSWGETACDAAPGIHRLRFATGKWFAGRGRDTFYPEVAITFRVADPLQHHHVPLLLSPFAYSTYRGS